LLLRSSIAALALLGLVSMGAAAEMPTPQACAQIADRDARLDCYDALFGAPPAAAALSPSEPATVTAPIAAAAPAAPVAAPAPASSSPATHADAVADVESVLVEITQRRTGEYVYRLENGERWTQVEANSAGRLEPGAKVTIKPAALGSHKLVSGHVATRVRRLD
jgi:hypothetical protein